MLVDFAYTDDPGSTAYMYGIRGWHDSPCASDYDPHAHADALGLPVIYRDLPEDDMVAAYSAEHEAIFVRPNLLRSVERCAIAHEIVHYEHQDIGNTRDQEDRADRIAARRLIRPWRLDTLHGASGPAAAALELGVTERIMTAYIHAIERGWYGR